METKTTIKRTTVVYEIVDRLVSMIQTGAFSAGERLPSERQLCETFKVSRSSLRTALQQLAFNGIVNIRQGSGTYISEDAAALIGSKAAFSTTSILPDGKEKSGFMERMECRILIEPSVARLAALYASDEDIANLENVIKRMRFYVESDKQAGFFAEDQNFHDGLAAACKNEMLRDIINNYCVNIAFHLKSFGRIPHLAENSLTQHEEILKAIKAKDPLAAEKAMREHVEYSMRENAKYIYGGSKTFRNGLI